VAKGFVEWTTLADGEGLDELEVTQREGFDGGASDEVMS
jgi:hypothetical protein